MLTFYFVFFQTVLIFLMRITSITQYNKDILIYKSLILKGYAFTDQVFVRAEKTRTGQTVAETAASAPWNLGGGVQESWMWAPRWGSRPGQGNETKRTKHPADDVLETIVNQQTRWEN